MKVKLDRAGIVALLSGPFGQAAVDAAAADIAGRVNATAHDGPVPVVVESHQAELSAAASVTLDHPGGLAIEYKHGPLAKAAAAGGYRLGGGAG
ncbi:hypothetical protein SEA_CEN1621_9 [Microbacterium phage Cen1621]|uniref:Uncharacterized protein n=1 Tax=Microbacterium phage Cen1621 TaxID=2965191 RepID=A0A9E7Q9R2_9CAUD|nr:hypothetical protein SEA_CEN1621_9 [Microbacterium phage Cen1621]